MQYVSRGKIIQSILVAVCLTWKQFGKNQGGSAPSGSHSATTRNSQNLNQSRTCEEGERQQRPFLRTSQSIAYETRYIDLCCCLSESLAFLRPDSGKRFSKAVKSSRRPTLSCIGA